MNYSWEIVWTKKVAKTYEKFPHKEQFKKAITDLKKDPYRGSNIKRLRGELEGLYRYRLGDYRLIYQIQEKDITIILIYLGSRGDAY